MYYKKVLLNCKSENKIVQEVYFYKNHNRAFTCKAISRVYRIERGDINGNC